MNKTGRFELRMCSERGIDTGGLEYTDSLEEAFRLFFVAGDQSYWKLSWVSSGGGKVSLERDLEGEVTFEELTRELPHAGEIVRDYLDHSKLSLHDLAHRSGLPFKTVAGICDGKVPITVECALAFERVFQRPASFWLNLQNLGMRRQDMGHTATDCRCGRHRGDKRQ